MPAAAGGAGPAEREARSQLVAGFNRLCEIVVRVQHEAREAHEGAKTQARLVKAGNRFRENLMVCSPPPTAAPEPQGVMPDRFSL